MPRIAKQDGYATEPIEGVPDGVRRKVAAGTIVPDHYTDVEGGTTDVGAGARVDPTVPASESSATSSGGESTSESESSSSGSRSRSRS
jgi:hypothetical protein